MYQFQEVLIASLRPRLRPRAPAAIGPGLLLVLVLTGCGAEAAPSPEPTATLPLPGPGESPSPSAEPTPHAEASEPEESEDGPLDGRTVVIDPGHNGANHTAPEEINRQIDAGGLEKNCDTVGAQTVDGYSEHEFNFEISVLVQQELESEGAEVLLTREDNEGVGPCLPERAGAANDVDADAALSIHADGGPEGGRGFHIIAPAEVPSHTEEIVGPSRRLGRDIRDHYEAATEMPRADYIAHDEGIDVRDDLGGLNLSTVPKVFLEAGNMRNDADAAQLADPEWQEQAATGVAAGIAAFLTDE